MRSIIACVVVGTTSLLSSASFASDPWVTVGDDRGVKVQTRARDGGGWELRAFGIIEAPAAEVFGLLCDVRSTMTLVPHLTQLQVLDESTETTVAYQRLDVPTIAPRDFTIRHECREEEGVDGIVHRVNEWRTDNQLGPPQKSGVVRLELNEGSWVLEEIDAGRRTRATYRLTIDPGGEIPRFIVDTAMRMSLPRMFESVGREATRAARTTRR